MLLSEFIKNKIELLKMSSSDAPRTDVLAILEFVLHKDRSWIFSNDDCELSEDNLEQLNLLIKKRQAREPLAYILGYKEFYGHKFIVNKDVLIPRPESESIIDIAKDIPSQRFIDVGTGSGCLAISLKLELPRAEVFGVDISQKALKLAKLNAKTLDAKVGFIKSDLLTKIDGNLLDQSCLLVNLPYVPDNLITSEEITKEPKIALFSGSDGMDLYEKFWEQVNNLSAIPSYIITESLTNQHGQMLKLANKASFKHHGSRDLIQVFAKN